MTIQYATKSLEPHPALSMTGPEAGARLAQFAARRAAKLTPPSEL
jgi:hypothetical protein